MYDKGKIVPGLIIFVGLFTFPLWYNAGNAGKVPKPEKPANHEKCIRPTEFMRTSHMVLLNQWRDEVIRENKREQIYVEGEGTAYPKKLQDGCMRCHVDKKKFCDECHTYAAVQPYCWDCHFPPKEKS